MKKKNLRFQIILNIIFILMCALVIFPFILLVSTSLSSESDIVKCGYSVIPRHIDFSAYRYVFKNPASILQAYKTTAIFSFASMFLNVLFMSMIAYPLSKKDLKGKNFISFYLYFTMLFGGGLVPTYILNTQYLHLDDTIWIYILPGLINPWYVFMMRTFFQGLPEEVFESAKIDGASQYGIYLRFVLPLSKPVLATVALFTFLGQWNNWYTSMLYINVRQDLVSLQYLLQRIMQNIKLIQEFDPILSNQIKVSLQDLPSETVRMAMAVIVAGPALVIFPFFQKYFTKGLTVGAVKG